MNPTSPPSQAAAAAPEAATHTLIEKARDHLGSAVVSDVLDAAGFRRQCLGHGLSPLERDHVIVGTAFPVAILCVLPAFDTSRWTGPVSDTTVTATFPGGELLSPSEARRKNEPAAVLSCVGTKYQVPFVRSTVPPVAPSRLIETGSRLGSLAHSET